LLCAHDGWERQFKEINELEAVVCATCAVRDSMVRDFPSNESAKIKFKSKPEAKPEQGKPEQA